MRKLDPDPCPAPSMNANPHTGIRNGNPGSGKGRRGAIIEENLKKENLLTWSSIQPDSPESKCRIDI
jgi:hypothetical protein